MADLCAKCESTKAIVVATVTVKAGPDCVLHLGICGRCLGDLMGRNVVPMLWTMAKDTWPGLARIEQLIE